MPVQARRVLAIEARHVLFFWRSWLHELKRPSPKKNRFEKKDKRIESAHRMKKTPWSKVCKKDRTKKHDDVFPTIFGLRRSPVAQKSFQTKSDWRSYCCMFFLL